MMIGDTIAIVCSAVALAYGIKLFATQKLALYFQMIIFAVGCHCLGYVFDVCELLTTGTLSEGFTIGYLGSIGCFLFLLTADFGFMDGILDDKTPTVRKSRWIALVAPAVLGALIVPNFFTGAPKSTVIAYALIWVPAMASSYFNLKHAMIPDMGFGFVGAIRPFNISALAFTFCQLMHLTLWNFENPWLLAVSGALVGAASIVMVLMAKRGVDKWTI